jgi:hypothetical protein
MAVHGVRLLHLFSKVVEEASAGLFLSSVASIFICDDAHGGLEFEGVFLHYDKFNQSVLLRVRYERFGRELQKKVDEEVVTGVHGGKYYKSNLGSLFYKVL